MNEAVDVSSFQKSAVGWSNVNSLDYCVRIPNYAVGWRCLVRVVWGGLVNVLMSCINLLMPLHPNSLARLILGVVGHYSLMLLKQAKRRLANCLYFIGNMALGLCWKTSWILLNNNHTLMNHRQTRWSVVLNSSLCLSHKSLICCSAHDWVDVL